ncbi:MAG: carbamoyl phosphate synthase small subunit [Phycisphaerae bacterium]|nr:carbamoyl phosphate synthase small subunit [Phycisphaerae bacterium]
MTTNDHRTARLALADGSIYVGRAFGATGRGVVSEAEVVFNTAMCGYQESLTDPSYAGQILVQTVPLIGNTGVNEEDVESDKVQVAGFIVHELPRRLSNARATLDLDAYLRNAGVLGLAGIDTRELTRRIRATGAMAGALTDREDISDADLVKHARGATSMAGRELVSSVARHDRESWTETLGPWGAASNPDGESFHVLAFDCGAKSNILRHLTHRGCRVTLIPFDISAADLATKLESSVDGVFISNGPGDPAAVETTIATLRDLLAKPAERAPAVFGICLGHQLLALAAGAKTYKLPFGHRGANQPVREEHTGRVAITSQNHGFAVDAASLEAAGGVVTHTHLNDGTVAGFRLKDRPVFAVQHHPEASPGPHDAADLFDRFVDAMRERRAAAVG